MHTTVDWKDVKLYGTLMSTWTVMNLEIVEEKRMEKGL